MTAKAAPKVLHEVPGWTGDRLCPQCGHTEAHHTCSLIPMRDGCHEIVARGDCGCLHYVEQQERGTTMNDTVATPPMDAICEACGFTYGKHYPTVIPANSCPDASGQRQGDGSTVFTPMEPGKGSRLRRWSCQCTEHTVRGKVLPGPYTFRGAASVEYSAFCQFCDAVFSLEPEAPAKKRKSVPCGAHCPAGSHTHV